MEKKLLHKPETKLYEQTIHRKYRNYKLIMFMSIIGLTFMFMSLILFYSLDRIGAQKRDLKLAPVFYWNTLLLLSSSMIIQLAKRYYREDNFSKYKTSLLLILSAGILFFVGQISGWIALFYSGYQFSNKSASFLYVISGIHALHIIGGLIFLSVFIHRSWKSLQDYSLSIVYFTDPVKQSQLNLFAIFWHFLGVMWISLLFFFVLIG